MNKRKKELVAEDFLLVAIASMPSAPYGVCIPVDHGTGRKEVKIPVILRSSPAVNSLQNLSRVFCYMKSSKPRGYSSFVCFVVIFMGSCSNPSPIELATPCPLYRLNSIFYNEAEVKGINQTPSAMMHAGSLICIKGRHQELS